MSNVRTSLFKATAAPQTSNQSSSNFAFIMEVTGYNLKANPPLMHGIRFDTKEPVSVSLRHVDGINKGEFKRPEIPDFAKPRKFQNDNGVVPGGMVYVRDLQPTGDNSFSARWINALSHEPGEAEILICTAHYGGVRKGKDKQVNGQTVVGGAYGVTTLLFDGEADHLSDEMRDKLGYIEPFTCSSLDEMRNDLCALAERNLGAGIRLKVGDQFDALNMDPQLAKDLEGVELEKFVDDFITTKFPDNLEELIASGAMIEIIPYSSVFMGKKSASDSLKKLRSEEAAVAEGKDPGRFMNKISRYVSDNDGDGGRGRKNYHYGKSLVALRMSPQKEDGSRALYFTVIEPMFRITETFIGIRDAICYAQTKNFSPEIVYADHSQEQGQSMSSPQNEHVQQHQVQEDQHQYQRQQHQQQNQQHEQQQHEQQYQAPEPQRGPDAQQVSNQRFQSESRFQRHTQAPQQAQSQHQSMQPQQHVQRQPEQMQSNVPPQQLPATSRPARRFTTSRMA